MYAKGFETHQNKSIKAERKFHDMQLLQLIIMICGLYYFIQLKVLSHGTLAYRPDLFYYDFGEIVQAERIASFL